MTTILVLALVIVIVVWAVRTTPITSTNNWGHTFPDLKFSTQEFYQAVEESIKKKQIPEIKFKRVTHSQGGLLGPRREYLRVSRDEYIFDICAAPFGTDFFVSCWVGESVRTIIAKIPIINTLAGKNPKIKTYYQADTESMFRGSIHKAVLEAIDHMTSTKGVRGLSEIDRRYGPADKL